MIVQSGLRTERLPFIHSLLHVSGFHTENEDFDAIASGDVDSDVSPSDVTFSNCQL